MAAETHPSEFHVQQHADVSGPLLAGFARFGLAGLTAVDYIVDQLELTPIGHIRSRELPSITPVEDGRPRYPTRILSHPDHDVTVLVGELFVPPAAVPSFSHTVIDWMDAAGVEEMCCLAGVAAPHGPEDHHTSWVATEDYDRILDTDIPPAKGGFLDGVIGAFVEEGLSEDLSVGVLTTPVHAQAPDADAAVRLVESVNEVYELDVDPGPLRAFAQEIQSYYEELAQRLQGEAEQEVPDDRMFM